MSVLSELNAILESLQIPFETGVYKDPAPDRYVVLVPIGDVFEIHADNHPNGEIQEVRLSLFDKGNYTGAKSSIVQQLLLNDFTITDRRYLGYDANTGYHHYVVDTAKYYDF